MFKVLLPCAASLALGAATLTSALAETAPSNALIPVQTQSTSVQANKTSDRTPGDVTPRRTAGANLWGTAGVDAAHTPFGTSDRTPDKHHHHPATN